MAKVAVTAAVGAVAATVAGVKAVAKAEVVRVLAEIEAGVVEAGVMEVGVRVVAARVRVQKAAAALVVPVGVRRVAR